MLVVDPLLQVEHAYCCHGIVDLRDCERNQNCGAESMQFLAETFAR